MKQGKIEIVYKRLDELRPDNDNPRRNEMAVDAVANSINEFGMRIPIIIAKDNRIIAGHTRYKACKRLGIDTVPCVVASDLSEKQLKAFQLADNKTGELATWDMAMLALQMESLTSIFDMSDFGFELQKQKTEQPDKKTDIDQEYEAPEGMVRCPRCGYVFEQESSGEEMLF